MEKYLSDAAHYPGGHAAAVCVPRTADDIPDIVRGSRTLLAIGAQSSLTGGATPMGETVLSTEKLTRIIEVGPAHLTVEAGVTVVGIQETLAARGAWFPPVPTFAGAFAGGIVATNAAGAATFRHGAVRRWVDAITVVDCEHVAAANRERESVCERRNPVKQSLLRELYGEDGVAAMRAVKHALDPGHKLAPGVIFA